MIYLGYSEEEKKQVIESLRANEQFDRIYMLTTERFRFDVEGVEVVTYNDLIQYAYYYRIIENTTSRSLIILNEVLRDRNRNNLTYNCIRTFLNNTANVLVFNFLPIIDGKEDFCSLFDFASHSKYKYSSFEELPLGEVSITKTIVDLNIEFNEVPLSLFDTESYDLYKQKLFSDFSLKDPDVIPRDLQIYASKFKKKAIRKEHNYICRNARIKGSNIFTYKKKVPKGEYVVFDIPFSMVDFADFLHESRCFNLEVLTSSLKVEQFFKQKLIDFKNNVEYVYSKI